LGTSRRRRASVSVARLAVLVRIGVFSAKSKSALVTSWPCRFAAFWLYYRL
jgi:hypothetical protein